ncbi:acyl-CoA dehydrogenase family protein [Chloroflexota bacterium]
MDFEFSEEQKKFQQEVRDFLNKEVTEELIEETESGRGWQIHTWNFLCKLGAKGWLAPAVPKEYGGMGSTHVQRIILENEMGYYMAMPGIMVGASIVAPTLLAYGSEKQRKEYIPRIAKGEIEFALGYTEPEAGSDLASLQIRAVKDGNDYIMNGQKVFNTGMHYSQYVWLAARTDPSVSKHRGISLFIVDVNLPGITIRPLYTMDGERTNEIFYDNVRVPGSQLVGEENRGWHYLTTALAFERNFPISRTRRIFDGLVDYCKETKRNGRYLSKDPLVRQSLAELKINVEIADSYVYQVAWLADEGVVPEWQAAMAKVFGTDLMHHVGNIGIQIMGLYGILNQDSKWVPLKGRIEHLYRQARRRAVTGGTQEIQRNIIALRGLGLPRG